MFEFFKAIFKGSGKVTVNGQEFLGKQVVIGSGNTQSGRDAFVNGTKINLGVGLKLDIKVEGDVKTLATSSGDVSCLNVGQITTASGDIKCADIKGNVSTASGDVVAKTITGDVNTMSGDISFK